MRLTHNSKLQDSIHSQEQARAFISRLETSAQSHCSSRPLLVSLFLRDFASKIRPAALSSARHVWNSTGLRVLRKRLLYLRLEEIMGGVMVGFIWSSEQKYADFLGFFADQEK